MNQLTEVNRKLRRKKIPSYPVSPVHGSGDHVRHGLADVVGHGHPGQLLLDGAVGVDLGAELGPLGGVLHRLLDDGALGAWETKGKRHH